MLSVKGIAERAGEFHSRFRHFARIFREMNSTENLSPERQQHAEGPLARAIETQTAKLPSDIFLWAGAASIALSLTLHLAGRKEDATFVGHWAPTLLLLGVYNKLVKLHGSDPLH
jgi:hypothetical protein